MRVAIIKSLTVGSVVSVLAYLMGGRYFQTEFPNTWGAIRVGCLLVDFVSVATLTLLLILWNDEFGDMPGHRIVIAICVMNWLFFGVFFIGLLMFL
jgi:hypothetical protein